jgi:F5/8 type C domain
VARIQWRPWSVVLAVWAIAGCHQAEGFNAGSEPDAQQVLIDTAGPRGTGGALGGTGGEPSGSGGSGGVGSGGAGSGGSGNPGSGGVDASTGNDVPGGSGGNNTPEVMAEVVAETPADTGAMDLPREVFSMQFCDRTQWTATASASSASNTRPPAGIDGDLTTRWGGRFQDGTDWYQVNFGGLVRLDSITLDNSKAFPDDFPGGYAVLGSTDGTAFTGPFVSGSGAQTRTVIQFSPQTVRAIRINQTGLARKTNWWQIGEFQIHCVM